jgi:hypothetical protein
MPHRNLVLIDELGHGLVLILAGDHGYKIGLLPNARAPPARGARP